MKQYLLGSVVCVCVCVCVCRCVHVPVSHIPIDVSSMFSMCDHLHLSKMILVFSTHFSVRVHVPL